MTPSNIYYLIYFCKSLSLNERRSSRCALPKLHRCSRIFLKTIIFLRVLLHYSPNSAKDFSMVFKLKLYDTYSIHQTSTTDFLRLNRDNQRFIPSSPFKTAFRTFLSQIFYRFEKLQKIDSIVERNCH